MKNNNNKKKYKIILDKMSPVLFLWQLIRTELICIENEK